MSKSHWRQWALRATTVLVVVTVPAVVWAYKEGWGRGRLVQSGTGCIGQYQYVTHTEDTGTMKVTARAAALGLTLDTSGQCAASGGNRYIRGTHRMMLYHAPINTDPNRSYGLCKLYDVTSDWTTGFMQIEKQWSNPPCGEGWYALVHCLTDVDTYIQGLPGGVRLGWYNATNVKTQCNVSPNWHPAIHDHGLEVGPAVTF
jgi:hypothetical protein